MWQVSLAPWPANILNTGNLACWPWSALNRIREWLTQIKGWIPQWFSWLSLAYILCSAHQLNPIKILPAESSHICVDIANCSTEIFVSFKCQLLNWSTMAPVYDDSFKHASERFKDYFASTPIWFRDYLKSEDIIGYIVGLQGVAVKGICCSISKYGWLKFVGWTGKGADNATSAINRGDCPQNKPPENQMVTSALKDKPVRLLKSLCIFLELLGFAICNLFCISIGFDISPWCFHAWELAGEIIAEPTLSITDAN